MSSYIVKYVYKFFREIYLEFEVMYVFFKFVFLEFNKWVFDCIFVGEIFIMFNCIGKLVIKKMKCNFKKFKIDWGEINKFVRKGIWKLVYFIEFYWY